MKRERSRKKSFPTIGRRVTALVLALWLLAMGLLTWAVAADMQMQVENTVLYFTDEPSRSYNGFQEIPEGLPGRLEAGMIDSFGDPYLWLWAFLDPLLPIVYEFDGVGTGDWLWEKWDLYYGYETAVAYFEGDELLITSGNYFNFLYTTQENWLDQDLEPVGYAYVDMDTLPMRHASIGYVDSSPMGDLSISMWLDVVRMTGYFEGNQFHPVTMDQGNTKYGSNPTLEQMCKMDGMENLLWNPIILDPIDTDRELVTIYAWDFGGIRTDTGPVTVEGIRYDTLEALVAECRDTWGRSEESNLLESVYIRRANQEDEYGAYTYVIAVRFWPLQYAALRLIPAYLVSFTVTAVLLLLLLRTIRRNLTQPLEELTDKIRRNAYISPDAEWAEPRAVQEYYATSRQALHDTNTQIAQLNTALEYARNAEESRRQLVSNITHELKTPLAVIHSYAEGLQAGIAGDKKEQYLNVILEESEKMDAMVLQMLDLSRLEAGRVRLESDQFSLLALTRSVAQKLQPLAEEKELEICYDLVQDFSVTADEGRISQVITNLMSNAIKYSNDGGQIHINLYSHQGDAYFRIENTCPHLSNEALEKVWDSFYRADPSRRSPGTGLGLTIVKTIVELHRGECTVRNTTLHTGGTVHTGVEFGFRIPL